MKSSQPNSASKQKLSAKVSENIPPFQTEQNKLSMLESNLNRVCLQQDALMPLLQMIEYIPSIQRTDSIVKGLMRKIEDNENKLQRHEKLLEKKFRENTQASEQPKKGAKQVEDLSQKVKDIEGQMNNLYRWYECKLKEESQQLQRNMEQKLEKQKNDMQRSFFNENSRVHSKQTSLSSVQGGGVDRSMIQAIEQVVQSSIEGLREQMATELQSMREEINQIKSQMK